MLVNALADRNDMQITEEQLAVFFKSCGDVLDCRVCGDPNSAMRFAFVEFATERAALQVRMRLPCKVQLLTHERLGLTLLQSSPISVDCTIRYSRDILQFLSLGSSILCTFAAAMSPFVALPGP